MCWIICIILLTFHPGEGQHLVLFQYYTSLFLLLLVRISPFFGKFCILREWTDSTESTSVSYGFCQLLCARLLIYRRSSLASWKEVTASLYSATTLFSFIFFSKESQSSLDMKSKLGTSKQTENGQLEPQNKVPAEDLALTFR